MRTSKGIKILLSMLTLGLSILCGLLNHYTVEEAETIMHPLILLGVAGVFVSSLGET